MRIKTGGRKKGTPNKISSQVKEKLSQVIDEGSYVRDEIEKLISKNCNNQ